MFLRNVLTVKIAEQGLNKSNDKFCVCKKINAQGDVMKKTKKTEKDKQKEMEEFSRKVREFREAQRKAFLNAVNENADTEEESSN